MPPYIIPNPPYPVAMPPDFTFCDHFLLELDHFSILPIALIVLPHPPYCLHCPSY